MLNTSIERIEVEGGDPITLVLIDYGSGSGKMIVECYGLAWACYWGAMGSRTTREFIARCDDDYIASSMGTKTNKEYLRRLARSVIDHCRAEATLAQALGEEAE
jgi:hypothetical protein